MVLMTQVVLEEVMNEETAGRDEEMELLGEPQEDGLKTTEELTEDQIDDLLGDEEPATSASGKIIEERNGQSSPLEKTPFREEVEEEPTSSEDAEREEEEIANQDQQEVVSSTEQIDEDSQDVEPTFTAHDLLAGEEDDEDGIVLDDEIGIIEPDGESNSSLHNGFHARDYDDDDEILVENEPTTSCSTEIPLLNRLSRQMLRSYLDRVAAKQPTEVYLMRVKSDTEKLKKTLAIHNHQMQAMRTGYHSREQEILLELAKEKQKSLDLITRLSSVNFKFNQFQKRPRAAEQIGNSDHSKTPLANPPSRQNPPETSRSPSFTAFKRQVAATRPKPYDVPRQTSVSAPEPELPDSNTSLPNRITVTLPLVENMRPCSVTDPSDSKPLNDYPPGLLKALHNGTGRVDVVLKTEYDSFLISKKLHGVVKFQPPEGLVLPTSAFIRLYYLVESMHDSWLFGSAAKISETGTKFTMGFHNDQRLYMGDRVSFIAYIYLDQQTKFVSEQAVFKMRRPVVQINAAVPVEL